MSVEQVAAAVQAALPFEGLPPDERALADEPRNDLGNARRLIARHGRDLIHVDEQGWLAWDGRRWAAMPSRGAPEALKRAHLTAEAIAREAAALEAGLGTAPDKAAEERVEKHWRWVVASGNSGRAAAMLEAAAPYLRRRPEELDAGTMLLNVANGTLDLAAAEIGLRAPERRDLVTHVSPVAFDPEAGAPKWRQFLAEVQPDEDVRVFLQTWFGYCATGETGEQVMVLCHGRGANGKSTLLETIAAALGDYAVTLPIQTFLADERRRGGDATPDLVRLPGTRLVLAAEPERGSRLSESVVKVITGGDKVVARQLFQGQFEFQPAFKLVLSANERPSIKGQDEGIWRRVILVPFEKFFTREKRDQALKLSLRAELPGILNWLLDGVRIWRERGLAVPASVRAATEEYRAESDPIGEFLRACTQAEPLRRVAAAQLFKTYVAWGRDNAINPVSATLFGRRLSDLGIAREKAGVHFYVGLELNKEGLDCLDRSTAHPPPEPG